MKLKFGNREYDTGLQSTFLIGGRRNRKELVEDIMKQATGQNCRVFCIGECDTEKVQSVPETDAESLISDIAGETTARSRYNAEGEILLVIMNFGKFSKNKKILKSLTEIEINGRKGGTSVMVETPHVSKIPAGIKGRLLVRYSSKADRQESDAIFGNGRAMTLQEYEYSDGLNNVFRLKEKER